jgi:hypothetical protein
VAERIVALTLPEPPGKTTHRIGRAMAKVTGVSPTFSASGARAGFSLAASAQALTRRWIQSTRRIFGNCYMGDDDPGLRWPWLYGLSAEVKASIDDRLIHNHWARIEKPPSFGRLSF